MQSKSDTKLILMRHGESQWNYLNLFTGWVDVALSQKGVEESIAAGEKIAQIPIDMIFVSSLIRAQMSALLAMMNHKSKKTPQILHPHQGRLESWSKIYSEQVQKECIPVVSAWQLNERMYGQLQGMNKEEMKKKFGQEQVQLWRRSFNEAPPDGESLMMTAARTIPYFTVEIFPYLQAGKNVFVCAHGNSLRAIVMHLEQLTQEQVVNLEIATGEPLIYTFAEKKWIKR